MSKRVAVLVQRFPGKRPGDSYRNRVAVVDLDGDDSWREPLWASTTVEESREDKGKVLEIWKGWAKEWAEKEGHEVEESEDENGEEG